MLDQTFCYQWLAQDRRERLVCEAQQAQLAKEARLACNSQPCSLWWIRKISSLFRRWRSPEIEDNRVSSIPGAIQCQR